MEIAGNLVEIVPDAGGLHRQILNLSQIGNDIIVERNQNTALIIVFLCTVIIRMAKELKATLVSLGV